MVNRDKVKFVLSLFVTLFVSLSLSFSLSVSLPFFSLASSGEFHCSFEEEPICMFTQDKNDDFDWLRHSAATRDTKYTPNTGPSGDRSGSKQGKEIWGLLQAG